MNRSRYVIRPIDKTDHAIIAALSENSRMTVRELAEQIGLSSPSVSERIHKLEDAGAIQGYNLEIDPTVFGLNITAYVRMRAMLGEVKRVEQLLSETPQIVEAHHISGEDCFLAKVVTRDMEELEGVIARFSAFASTDTAIVLSSTVKRRLPKL